MPFVIGHIIVRGLLNRKHKPHPVVPPPASPVVQVPLKPVSLLLKADASVGFPVAPSCNQLNYILHHIPQVEQHHYQLLLLLTMYLLMVNINLSHHHAFSDKHKRP